MRMIGEGGLALAMIAAFVLILFGARLARRNAVPGDRKRGLLMLAAAAVLIANVLIWTV